MKKTYKTPTLKVVQFKAESGFATSAFSARSTEDGLMEFEMLLENGEEPCNEQYIFSEGTNFWN